MRRLAAALACATAAGPASGAPQVACRVETEPRGALTELRGVVEADTAMEVEAQWTLRRIGRGGRSANRQGTRASLTPGTPRVVARSILSVAPGDRLDATLVARWPGGETTCAWPDGGAPPPEDDR